MVAAVYTLDMFDAVKAARKNLVIHRVEFTMTTLFVFLLMFRCV